MIIRNLLSILTLTFIIISTSCNEQDRISSTNDIPTKTITFNISTDSLTSQTKTEITDTPSRYIMEVWSESGEDPILCFEDKSKNKAENTTGNFEITLENPRTETYICLFWADNGSTTGEINTYNTSSLREIKLNNNQKMISNSYFKKFILTPKLLSLQNIELKRAVAKINFIEKGTYTAETNTLNIEYDNYYFNIFDGETTKISGEKITNTFNNITNSNKDIATDFVFAPTTGNELISISIKLNNDPKRIINNIPVHANRLTNLTGEFSYYKDIALNFNITTEKQWNAESTDKELYQIGSLYPDKANPTGIVFEHGVIISLTETVSSWSNSNGKTNAISTSNGMENMSVIKLLNNFNNYPAFSFCNDKGEGWYLPAKDELFRIYENKTAINDIITKITSENSIKTELKPKRYWSSTEDSQVFRSLAINMDNGTFTATDKTINTSIYVRCIKDI